MTLLKSQKEIFIMKEGGRILSDITTHLKKISKSGIRTKDLEEKARELIKKRRAEPSFLGFNGYPAALCTSINEQIVHALPSERKLNEGDILSIDLGILWKGYHTDMAVTIAIGKVLPSVSRLIKTTEEALKLAISKVKPGNTLGDIGSTIQNYVEKKGLEVIRDLCGHGIGKRLHEPPQVLNFGESNKGEKIKEGMVFCIEPMVSMGNYRIKKSIDGFGYETKDKSLSCHFEHTVAVGKKGAIIITK